MAFEFIYGSDDYLVEQAARERFAVLKEGLDPEFGLDILDGRCQKVDEVVTLVNRLREATQTMGLFGGARAVWLRSVNFIADTQTGRAEGTLEALEEVKIILEAAKAEEVKILVSATPVDKRLSFFKWAVGKSQAKEIAGLEGMDSLKLDQMAREKNLAFDTEAAEVFLKKVGTGARAVLGELEKLSLYFGSEATADKPGRVTLPLILELTSQHAEGEFFEPLEAFYSRKATWALESMRTYFLENDGRPLLAAFLGRNRLMLMLRAAVDAGMAKGGFKGITWSAKAESLKLQMGAEKTPFNLFAQNPWYLGRLSQEAMRFTLEELEAIQAGLVDLFEALNNGDQTTAFEGFVVKHLAKA